VTSLTLAEWQPLVLPFQTAFQAHMAAWRLDGKPRTAHRYATSQNCPLPTLPRAFVERLCWIPAALLSGMCVPGTSSSTACPCGYAAVVNSSAQQLSVPTSTGAKSWTNSLQSPFVLWPWSVARACRSDSSIVR